MQPALGSGGAPVIRRHDAPAGSDIQRAPVGAASQPATCCADMFVTAAAAAVQGSQAEGQERILEESLGVCVYDGATETTACWKYYSLSTEELHAEQSEDHNEEEEEEEQADDRLHGVEKGNDEIPQRVPVSESRKKSIE